MAKILLLGDLHFGVRGGDQSFLDFQKLWFDEIFFPYIRDNDISHMIQVGDFFDTRQHMKLNVLHEMSEWFVPRCEAFGVDWTCIVGNHDIYYRDSNNINSLNTLQRFFDKGDTIHFDVIVDDVVSKELGGKKFAFVPWINKNNKEKILQQLDKVEADCVVGHFEFTGMPMYKDILSQGGLDPSLFKKFDKIISGHYHTISHHTNVTYLGTPYHLTWADYPDGNNRGFWILDTDTNELELIKNPEWASMFSVIDYDPEYIYTEEFFEKYEGNISKVIISEVLEERHKKRFVEFLSKAKFLDYKIIDTTMIKMEKVDISVGVIDNKSLINIMDDYIDKQKFNSVDVENVKNLTKDIFLEASKMGY